MQLLSIPALPPLMFSSGWGVLVPSRGQLQAAEVRQEKGQSQIPRWGWNCRRKSQSEGLRRAFLHHPALPQSCLGWGGATLTWECEKMLGLVSHGRGQEELGGR